MDVDLILAELAASIQNAFLQTRCLSWIILPQLDLSAVFVPLDWCLKSQLLAGLVLGCLGVFILRYSSGESDNLETADQTVSIPSGLVTTKHEGFSELPVY